MATSVRRLTALAIVAGASCNVYSPSLLTGSGGSGSGAAGGSGGTSGRGGAGSGGDAGTTQVAGKGGSSGGAGNGGTAGSGGTAGDSAGSANGGRATGGMAGVGGSTGGSDVGGAGGEVGGEAGMDTGVGGSAGGGMAGSGGSAGGGMGGTAGGGMGGSAGGGMAGMGGTPATGCAKLTIPMDATNDKAHFVISLANNTDFSAAGTTISMHVYVEAGAAGSIFNYVQDGSGNFRFLGPAQASWPSLKAQVGKWSTLTWNVGSEPVGGSQITKTIIKRIGIEVNAQPDTAGWSASTVIYIDSITVNTPALSYTFDAVGSVSTATNLTGDQSGNVLWLNSNSQDTTATPLTAPSWVDACP